MITLNFSVKLVQGRMVRNFIFMPEWLSRNFFLKLGHPGVRSRYATLSVLVAPDAPTITQGANLVTTEGREIRLECVSANGRPASEVSFTL